MRNGDFSPSRYDAQFDSCNLICGQRSEDNTQSSLALVTSAGDRSEVKVTLTNDIGEIVTALHRVKIGGVCNFAQSLKISQLVLLHKRNPNQSLRIITFVGSPIKDEESDLVRIAEILRKNKISVDIVSFGETEMNDSKLDLFFTTLNNSDNSHLIKVPTGLGVSLSDYLRQTPILPSTTGGTSGGGDFGGGDFGFDVNPNTDPELYEAMQLSRQTYEQETKKPETETNVSGEQQDQIPQLEPDENVNMYDEDVQEAIRLSLQTGELQNQTKVNNTNNNDEVVMSEAQPQQTTNTTEPKKDIVEEAVDVTNLGSEFFEDVLKDLDGVEMDNPDIQQLIMNFKKDEKKKINQKKKKIKRGNDRKK